MRRDPRRGLSVAAASIALHGLLGWALLTAIPAAPTLVEPRSVVVSLLSPAPPATPDTPPTPRRPPRPAAAPTERPATVTPVPRLAVPAIAGGPAPITAPPGFVSRGTPTGGGEALRQAARQGGGCNQADVLKLSKAEREACNEALGAKNKNGPALYAAIDPDKKAAFDGDCKKDDDWCLYRTGKGPYPGLFALGKKRKIKGWD